MAMDGRPRANRAEDWSPQPPEEGCLGYQSDLEAVVLGPTRKRNAAPAVTVQALAPLKTAAADELNCVSDGRLAAECECELQDVDRAVVEMEDSDRPDPEVLHPLADRSKCVLA